MDIQLAMDLSPYNTFGLSVQAEYGCIARSKQDIIDAVSFAREKQCPIRVFGLGSNILLPDTMLPGLTVIHRYERFDWNDDISCMLGGGNMLAKSIFFAAEKSTDASMLLGYPSTIGGGIRGNSGLRGVGVGDFLIEAELIDTRNGEIVHWKQSDFQFSYRHSRIKDEPYYFFIEGKFRFPDGDISKETIQELQSYRQATQPIGKCAGCFFMNPVSDPKNPEKYSAGYFIDTAGCKGKKHGGAYISDKHANFLMSDGSATSADIIALASEVKEVVLDQCGVHLEYEVDTSHLLI